MGLLLQAHLLLHLQDQTLKTCEFFQSAPGSPGITGASSKVKAWAYFQLAASKRCPSHGSAMLATLRS